MRSATADLKARARQALIGKYSIVILAYLLSDIISYGLSALIPMSITPKRGWFSSLQLLICILIICMLTILLSVGSNRLYLNIARERPYRITDIFYCFTYQPDRIILLTLRLILVNLVCLLPFFVAAGAVGWFLPARISDTALFLILSFFFLLIGAVLLSINLRYFLVYYLCLDEPQLSTREIMKKSASLMLGRKKQALWLLFSFLVMGLLVLLSLGVGILWVQPYFSMTAANFYLDVISNSSRGY